MHESIHLFVRASPILSGKGINGQILNSEFNRSADDASQVFGAGFMSSQTRQSTRECPTTVPIHDDGNMTRSFFKGGIERWVGHKVFFIAGRVSSNSQ